MYPIGTNWFQLGTLSVFRQMSAVEKIVIRLYANRDDDLLNWLETISNDHGAKSAAIKSILRRGLEKTNKVVLTTNNRFDDDVLESLLSSFRLMIENVIRSELAKMQPTAILAEDTEVDIHSDIEHQLDALGSELINGL